MPITLRRPLLTSRARSAAARTLSLSLSSLPFGLGFLPQNAFQPLSLYHADTLTYQEYKHAVSLAHKYTQPSIRPMLSRQINSWSQRLAAHLVGRIQRGPSMQKREREASNPHPASELEGSDSFPVKVKDGEYNSATWQPRSLNSVISLPLILFCFFSLILRVSHSAAHLSRRHSVLWRFDCTKSRGKGPLCRHSS